MIGDLVDCKDTCGKWLNARIIDRNDSEVKVTYTDFSSQYDEWISVNNSDRLLVQFTPQMSYDDL